MIPSHWCNMYPFSAPFLYPQKVRNYYTPSPAPMGWRLCWERHMWNTGISASWVAAQHQTLNGSNTGHRSWRGKSLMPCLLQHALTINQINGLQKAERKELKSGELRSLQSFPSNWAVLCVAIAHNKSMGLKRLTKPLPHLWCSLISILRAGKCILVDRYLKAVFPQRGILPPVCANPFLLMDLANGPLFVPLKATYMVLLKTLKLSVACRYSLAFRVLGARSPQTHGVKRGWPKGRWAKEDAINKLLLALLKFVCFLRVTDAIFSFVNYHPWLR